MKNWTEFTIDESYIERLGVQNMVIPHLQKHYEYYRIIPSSTPLQTKGKIDGWAYQHGEPILLEWKCVTRDYERIFAEFKAERDDGKCVEGWIAKKSIFPSTLKSRLIYAMSTKLYEWDYNQLREWYKGQDKHRYETSTKRDEKCQQMMYGHLIPVAELEQFRLVY